MTERYEGGGMGRETWASESGVSDACQSFGRLGVLTTLNLIASFAFFNTDGSQQGIQGYSRSSTPTYEESREGHRAQEPYVCLNTSRTPEFYLTFRL